MFFLTFKQATSIASHMVKDLGMSSKVGLRTFDDRSEQLIGSSDSLGHTTKEIIDGEIKKLLQVNLQCLNYFNLNLKLPINILKHPWIVYTMIYI